MIQDFYLSFLYHEIDKISVYGYEVDVPFESKVTCTMLIENPILAFDRIENLLTLVVKTYEELITISGENPLVRTF